MGRMLLNETFGGENFRRELVWELKGVSGYKSLTDNYVRSHDTILYYTKYEKPIFNKLFLDYDEKQLKRFSSTDENGRKYKTITKERRLYLDEANGVALSDVWSDIASFQTIVNSPEIVENSSDLTQKPEALLQRIIKASSDENSIILDYHLGSGTSVVAAQKLGRKWLGVEMGEHFYSVIIPRLKKVLGGAQCGISKDVNYKGGGAFRYFELESYEEALNECEYALDENGVIDYRKSRKLIKSLNKGEKVCLDMSGYRQNFDIFVSYANLIGTNIKRIFTRDGVECVEFSNGEIMRKDDIDMAKFPKITELIWWRE